MYNNHWPKVDPFTQSWPVVHSKPFTQSKPIPPKCADEKDSNNGVPWGHSLVQITKSDGSGGMIKSRGASDLLTPTLCRYQCILCRIESKIWSEQDRGERAYSTNMYRQAQVQMNSFSKVSPSIQPKVNPLFQPKVHSFLLPKVNSFIQSKLILPKWAHLPKVGRQKGIH